MKKAQAEFLQTSVTFEVIIGLLIALIFFFSVYNLNTDESFTKTFLENDLSLMVGVLESSSKHIVVEYPLGKNNYRLKVENGKIKVDGKKQLVGVIENNIWILEWIPETKILHIERKK